MPADLATLLSRLAAEGLPVELAYHPDADPGDGSGWAVLVGDRTTYGTLEAVVDRLRGEVPDGR